MLEKAHGVVFLASTLLLIEDAENLQHDPKVHAKPEMRFPADERTPRDQLPSARSNSWLSDARLIHRSVEGSDRASQNLLVNCIGRVPAPEDAHGPSLAKSDQKVQRLRRNSSFLIRESNST